MTRTLSERKYGVEIEFTGIDQNTAVEAIRSAGIDITYEGYNHTTISTWKLVYDSSCGLEAVSPILQGEEGLRQIATVCNALNAAGAMIDRRCGYHVHLDVSDFEMRHFKNLIKLWIKFEDVFDTFQPESRKGSNNQYCRSNLKNFGTITNGIEQATACRNGFTEVDRCRSIDQLCRLFGTRYMKLNCEAYFRHRTIEVRHHAGTLNADKAVNWVLLMMELYETAKSAKTIKARPASEQSGIARHKWFFQRTSAPALRKFYSKRARQLAAA
jgi:hypothetical protein